MEEDIKILREKINYLQNRIVIALDNSKSKKTYIEEMSKEKQAIENILNELERLQKENNDLRTIRETVRYLEEEGEKDDLYYVVGRGSYLAKVLENAQDFKKTVHTCLHCGNDTPLYCEKCYQELISKNAELQAELKLENFENIELIEEKLENAEKYLKLHDDYQQLKVLEDDLKDKRIAYIDTPEFKEQYIPKQVIRNKINKISEHIHVLSPNASKLEMRTEFLNEGAIRILEELLGE